MLAVVICRTSCITSLAQRALEVRCRRICSPWRRTSLAIETAIIAAVSAAPSRAQLRPGQVCGFPSPHPDQGLTHGQGYQVGQGIAADRS